jgi:hypothetical protein
METAVLVCQKWTLVNRCGVTTHAGHTVHLNYDSQQLFVNKINIDHPPTNFRYFKTNGEPFKLHCYDSKLLSELKKHADQNGLWYETE